VFCSYSFEPGERRAVFDDVEGRCVVIRTIYIHKITTKRKSGVAGRGERVVSGRHEIL